MVPDLSTEPVPAKTGSRLIRRILMPAIRLWLNTQIEEAQNLAIAIESSDRQILGGYIPSAQIAATAVVYRGLHFGSIDVVAHNICTNGLQVLRGHAFKLLEPIPIDVNLVLMESDLNRSLQTDLFSNAVDELMRRILRDCMNVRSPDQTSVEPFISGDGLSETLISDDFQFAEPHLSLNADRLVVCGKLIMGDRPLSLYLGTGLSVVDGQTLVFDSPHLTLDKMSLQGRSLKNLEHFSIDLGETTHLSVLTIDEQCLRCQGQILVMP